MLAKCPPGVCYGLHTAGMPKTAGGTAVRAYCQFKEGLQARTGRCARVEALLVCIAARAGLPRVPVGEARGLRLRIRGFGCVGKVWFSSVSGQLYRAERSAPRL